MKISQAQEFKPITIILETKEEVEALWEAVRLSKNPHISFISPNKDVLIHISDWFSNSAKL